MAIPRQETARTLRIVISPRVDIDRLFGCIRRRSRGDDSTEATPVNYQRPDNGLETSEKLRARPRLARQRSGEAERSKPWRASLRRDTEIHRVSSPLSGRC